MEPTDEELLHAFYRNNDMAALEQLAARHETNLIDMATLVLRARSGSLLQAQNEWDPVERVADLWNFVLLTRVGPGRWPHARLSVLTWLNHVLCIGIDNHLELRPPF